MSSSSNGRVNRPEWDRILSAAQKNNSTEILRLVSEEGVSASHANAVEQSALHIAALWGNVEALKALLSLSATTNAKNSITGGTPLHCTVQSSKEPASNRVTCAKLLIEVGMADPNLGDFYDATPLDYLEHSRNNTGGTDKPQLTNFGRGEEASDEEFYTQMRDVLTSGAGPSAALEVFEYIQQFDFDGLKFHLQQKSEDGVEDLTLLLEERERGGMTPLLYVIGELQKICQEATNSEAQTDEDQLGRMTQIVTLLLERGALANATPKRIELRTPFSPPPTDKNPEEVEESVEAALSNAPMHTICTELYSINASSSTPSESSLRPCLEKVAVTLQGHGATLSRATCGYMHDAARRGYLDTVQFWTETLLVDIDAKGRQGMTALHFAARSGRVDIVRYLLTKGADRGCVDDRGKTALDAATVNGKDEVVGLLNSMDD
mmetsp:Transcript_33779/g.40460  ORF Transcript_33779/g.40460 Transcript_33779/m.40460 type:complete len:436 (+) Transcript_33779:28-1335(+)